MGRIRRSCPTEGMNARVLDGMARDRPSPYGDDAIIVINLENLENPASDDLHDDGNPLACACGMRGPSPYGQWHVF